METKTYLDFDEAVEFLKTTPSTLYKWLQAGKVPGHKLGRQWRFLKEELELHMSGKSASIQYHKEVLDLAGLLTKRAAAKGGLKMETSIQQISEQLIWDAYQHGSRLIHVEPSQGRFQIKYRNRNGLDQLTNVSEETFKALDRVWREESSPSADEDTRRMFLHRNEGEALQIRYQKLETITGPRVTLQLWQPFQDVLPLEKIVNSDEETLKTFKNWCAKSHGLIVVCGSSGSGKTTTVYSMINEIKKTGSVIFTIEKPVHLVIDGINQAEFQNSDDFNTMFEKIYNSDPDVICVGLGINTPDVYAKACNAALNGHLVVLQMNAGSTEEAYETLKDASGIEVEKILVGICHQKLVPAGNNRIKAQYSFYETEK